MWNLLFLLNLMNFYLLKFVGGLMNVKLDFGGGEGEIKILVNMIDRYFFFL